MGNVMTYSGIVTKIRAMQSKLLSSEDYDNIASMRNVTEIASFLREHPGYHEFLYDVDESLYHRGNIEKILYQSLYKDYAKLYRFSSLKQRTFLKLYLKSFEVELIISCLRNVFNHSAKAFDLAYKKAFFERYSHMNIDLLYSSSNLDELVENLKETEYYSTLSKLKESGAASLYDYNLALNLYYFTSVWKLKKRLLKKKELEIFTQDCGAQIDLLNLQWIYRAKKYYHLAPADIYMLTIPIHHKIHLAEFKTLVEAPTVEEFNTLRAKTSYARKYDFEQNKTLETMYKECLHKLYVSGRRKDPYSIASITTYLFLKEEEINKLTTALECVRYGLTPRETLGYLGGVTS